MEIGAVAEMATYAGGLGVLAGGTGRSAADIGLSMVGVTLLHRKGYLHQQLDATGRQIESPQPWNVQQFLVEQPQRVTVTIEGRPVHLRCCRYVVKGTEGEVPIYFLDADLPENANGDRTFTDVLYGGDERYRLCQEILLGIGGVRMLRALGYHQIDRFHMNEGHSSLLVMELLLQRAQAAGRATVAAEDVEAVRQCCIFTTHTPVPDGHDQFSMEAAVRILGESPMVALQHLCCHEGRLNLTTSP
jgi:glycogen phosphorylase